MADNVEKRLEQNSLGGTPLLKPDEQNKYLGTFKERCVAVLSKDQGSKERLQELLKGEIEKHPGGRLLINDELPSDQQEIYLQLALEEKIPFTIVNRDITKDQTEVGVVYALDDVSGVKTLDLEEKYPVNVVKKESSEVKEEKSKPFWKRLF